jgi:phytoene dehydrogenase-like protein
METSYPVVIIGGGAAGLSCAYYLHKAGIHFLLLEASDAVGGRIRTDLVEGFRLDRGFQILLTSYPEVRQLLDFGSLQLGAFRSGAMVRTENGFARFPDPLREPTTIFTTLSAPIGTLEDKLRLLKLRQEVKAITQSADFFLDQDTDTLSYLQDYGWSERMISRFFRPFFGGVFLENDLVTSSNFFRFVFKQFAMGDAALPARGMQAIPDQLATGLPTGAIRLGARVASVQGQIILLENGERFKAEKVVIATDAATADGLLQEAPGREYNVTTCTYFAAPASPLAEKMLILNPHPLSVVHHMCIPSDVAPGYAPEGQSLIAVSTQGLELADDKKLAADIKLELGAWFGQDVEAWHHLRTYHLPQALVRFDAGHHPETLQLTPNLYRCGDYTAYPSLNAALQTGRQVAEKIIAQG